MSKHRCASVESEEEEDWECEACRSGSGCELTAGGADGGWTSSETSWSQSGDGRGSGGKTERGWKSVETNAEGKNIMWLLNALEYISLKWFTEINEYKTWGVERDISFSMQKVAPYWIK